MNYDSPQPALTLRTFFSTFNITKWFDKKFLNIIFAGIMDAESSGHLIIMSEYLICFRF